MRGLMHMIPGSRTLTISLLVLAGILVFGACSSDSSDPDPTSADPAASPTGPQVTSFENADTDPKSLEIYREFVGMRELHASGPQNLGAFSRFNFYFVDRIPSYDAAYITNPIACGSGEPVDIAGEAFLEITFAPAAAQLISVLIISVSEKCFLP